LGGIWAGIFESFSDDGKIKMYELLGKTKDVHVMELPRTQYKESSKLLWLDEINILQRKIKEKFHPEITEAKLREAIGDVARLKTRIAAFIGIF
jgi:benzoyl-CoA reductase/2-hydroxyglutaryl-CoA dehydratase subunit BcrC/BadD/HgdB